MKRLALVLLAISLVHVALCLVPISREAIPGISGIWAANMFAQELSGWFAVLNVIGLVLSLRRSRIVTALFGLAALFSLSPFFQVPGVNEDMTRQWLDAGMDPPELDAPGAVSVFLASFSLADPEALSQVQEFSQRILYYAPASPPTAVPVVIDIHGGSWQHGSPEEDAALSRYLAARGYAVFAIDYRRAPAHPHPAQIDDVRQAISWVESNASRFGADASRIALIGHSAGGHLAMLAAYAQPDSAIRAVVSFYGPADLYALYQHPSSRDPLDVPGKLETLIGQPFESDPQAFRDASPIRYVKSGLPPTLQIQGGRDHIVPARLTRAMHHELLRAGNRSLLLELPWSEHSFDMLWFGPGNRLARAYIDAFLAETLQ